MLTNKIDTLEVKVNRIETTQSSHTEMIGELMEDTLEIKIELKNKVDRKEFIELKQTVLAMS